MPEGCLNDDEDYGVTAGMVEAQDRAQVAGYGRNPFNNINICISTKLVCILVCGVYQFHPQMLMQFQRYLYSIYF